MSRLVDIHGWGPVSIATYTFANMYIFGVQARCLQLFQKPSLAHPP